MPFDQESRRRHGQQAVVIGIFAGRVGNESIRGSSGAPGLRRACEPSSERLAVSDASAAQTLFGRKPLTCIQPDALTVEHRILYNRSSKFGVFLRASQAFRERRVFGELRCEVIGDALR